MAPDPCSERQQGGEPSWSGGRRRWAGGPRPPGAIGHFGPKSAPSRRDFRPGRKATLEKIERRRPIVLASALAEEDVQDHREDDRQDEAGRDREVNGHVPAPEGDVAWQMEAPEEQLHADPFR